MRRSNSAARGDAQTSRRSMVQLPPPLSSNTAAPLQQSINGRSDSVRSLRRSSSVMGSRSKLKRGSSVLMQRLELARRRTDAAMTIQRTWHRWYVSAARRRRLNAAMVIQRAWGSRFLLENARRELRFLRWLRARRLHLKGLWQRVTTRLQLREAWCQVTIAAFKNRCVWRQRLVMRRRNRHAAKIQRWWRQHSYNRRTWWTVMWSVELKETLRFERVARKNIVAQERSMFACAAADAQEQFDAALVDRLEAWYQQHRLPLDVSPRLKRAAERQKEAAAVAQGGGGCEDHLVTVLASTASSAAAETVVAPVASASSCTSTSSSSLNLHRFPLPQKYVGGILVAVPPAAPLMASVPHHVQLRRMLALQRRQGDVVPPRCSSALQCATGQRFAVHVRPPSAGIRGRVPRCPEEEL